MDVDPGLYSPGSGERFEHELLEKVRVVMDTDEMLALSNVFQLIGGYAEHLREGMEAVKFDVNEAATQAWRTAWGMLRRILEETSFGHEFATTMERGLPFLHTTTVTDSGEPLDPTTRTFYQTFIDRLEHPAVHPTATWLYEK